MSHSRGADLLHAIRSNGETKTVLGKRYQYLSFDAGRQEAHRE